MATTKIWPIHEGSSMKLVIGYVENPDKTTQMTYVLETEAGREYTDFEHRTMTDVMEYAMNDYKTCEKKLVSGVNVSAKNAREEMMTTKFHYGKEDGIILWHGYQSFMPGEVTGEEAHKIGVQLAQNLWGKDYEVIVCTHMDQEHIHNHFVINSVSFRTGKKLDAKWQDMARESDRLCEIYGKSVIENPQFRGKHYAQYKSEKQGEHTWNSRLKSFIDVAILSSYSIDDFFGTLKENGYQVKIGKYISIKPPGAERFIRTDRRWGDAYTINGIQARITENVKSGIIGPKPAEKERKVYHCNHPVKNPGTNGSIGGYMGLYYFYCYKLGVFQKKPVSHRKINYLYYEELKNIDKISRATRFLAKNNIKTDGDLKLYEDKLNNELSGLKQARRNCYNESRCASEERKVVLQNKINTLNSRIKVKSRELNIILDVKERTKAMVQKQKELINEQLNNENQKNKEKEA